MKLRKNISKIITLSIFLNNICFYSNASSLNRYETLEGEVITLDGVEDKDITEIEIFGNTVQDSNDLNYIQSIGDLYVDEQGEPILDNSGRKQYKVEILSTDYNRLYSNKEIVDIYNNMGYSNVKAEITSDGKFKCINNGAWVNPNKVFKGKPNTEYTFSFKTMPGYIYTNGLVLTRNHSESVKTYRTDSTGKFGFLVSPNIGDVFDFKIYEGNIANINEIVEKKMKITILLPSQLMKVGNIKDRLYWDVSKRKYIIEKNVYTNTLKSMTSKYNEFFHIPTYKTNLNTSILDGDSVYRGAFLVQGFEHNGYGTYAKIKGNLNASCYKTLNLRLYPYKNNTTSEIENLSIEQVNDIIGEGKTVYFPYKSPELIETNITKKIEIITYSNKTYVSIETKNGIKSTLKIVVDKIEQVSQEAVDTVISNPTSSNIALARMFVNMLPDSLYKDQLQAQLDKLFSSDMVLDKKSASSNLDLYIKSENILILSLDTNSITFDDFSGTEDVEKLNAINIMVNSSLPYQVNAYLPNEIQNNDKSNTMSKDILNIKESSEQTYKRFANINEKIILKDNCNAGNNIKHSIDLMIKGGIAHEKDIYKTTIKFEVEQK